MEPRAEHVMEHQRVGDGAEAGDADLVELVGRAAAGDEPAWQRLWAGVEPWLLKVVARPSFLGRLGQREDDRRGVVVEVMARLRARDFERLRRYLDARAENPQLAFLAWLRVVAKRVGIDYMRAHPDYVDRRREADASRPGRWIDVAPLPSPSRIGEERPGMTARGTAHQLMAYAAELPAPQQEALTRWVAGEPFADIARALDLRAPADAERVVRAVLERLRRRFRRGEG